MHHVRLLALSGLLALVAARNPAVAEDVRFFRIVGPAATTITEFRPDGTLVWTNALAGTNYIVQVASTLAGEANWVDYVQLPTTNYANTNWIVDFQPPSGMVLIPAGSFTMGDTFKEGYPDENVTRTVDVSAFYMDRYEVTKAFWDDVYNCATNHGYSFDYADSGLGKAVNHPAHTMTWYDAVKWCNARSEKEGLTPAYYTDADLSMPYRSGQVAPFVNWNANGYRLPTEAEWEKAARGGRRGLRFPWGNTITWSQANYLANRSWPYDLNPTPGNNPIFRVGSYPYTSPVGYFAANGYGLYDTTGNLWEWCWDWTGSQPVARGGSFSYEANACRTAARIFYIPTTRIYWIGFRCVRTAVH